MTLPVRVQRLPSNPDLPLPERGTVHAAGFDVRSSDADFVLRPGESRLVGTGLVLEIPEGVECQVRPRSGLALKHGIIVPNSPGTIDPDYRGELRVLLHNLGPTEVAFARGERIAQLVFARFLAPDLVETADLSVTARGEGGFGSTGRA